MRKVLLVINPKIFKLSQKKVIYFYMLTMILILLNSFLVIY